MSHTIIDVIDSVALTVWAAAIWTLLVVVRNGWRSIRQHSAMKAHEAEFS